MDANTKCWELQKSTSNKKNQQLNDEPHKIGIFISFTTIFSCLAGCLFDLHKNLISFVWAVFLSLDVFFIFSIENKILIINYFGIFNAIIYVIRTKAKNQKISIYEEWRSIGKIAPKVNLLHCRRLLFTVWFCSVFFARLPNKFFFPFFHFLTGTHCTSYIHWILNLVGSKRNTSTQFYL